MLAMILAIVIGEYQIDFVHTVGEYQWVTSKDNPNVLYYGREVDGVFLIRYGKYKEPEPVQQVPVQLQQVPIRLNYNISGCNSYG